MKIPDHDQRLYLDTWAYPRPGLSLDALIQTMTELGNTVLDVDYDNNRLLMQHDPIDVPA